MNSFSKFVGVLICVVALPMANADIVQYEDAAGWSMAAGAVDFVEDFNDFETDDSFTGIPLQLNGFVVEALGEPISDLNFIDVGDFAFGGALQIDETPYLAGGVDFGLTDIDLEFDLPVSAFAGDFRDADGAEMLEIEVLDSTGNVLGLLNPSQDDTFLGFVATGGEQVAGLRFYSSISSGGREAFGLDNAQGVLAIPEPSALAIVVTCALFGTSRRRR